MTAHNDLPAIEETVIEESRDERAKWEMQLQELRLKEKTDFLSFRKEWSRNILYLVIFIVVFTAVFLVAVGLGYLTFMDEWLVRIIITGSFIEVLGLAKIVVDFLFKEPPIQ